MVYQILWVDGKDHFLISQTKILFDKDLRAKLGGFNFLPKNNSDFISGFGGVWI